MEDNTPVVVQSKTIFNPERDTSKAKKAADKLIDIVKQNGWSIKVGGQSEHLMYEAWQTVGKYYNVTVSTGDAEPVEIDNINGFKAKAWVVDNKTGVRVGEAEAYCMRDEPNWKSKPTFQLASMAQTRAGSKALRQMFGFVVALAGYNPTPAEEMIGMAHNDNFQAQEATELATEKQWNFIKALWGKAGADEDELEVYVMEKFKLESYEELTKDQASLLINKLNEKTNEASGTIAD